MKEDELKSDLEKSEHIKSIKSLTKDVLVAAEPLK